MKGLKYKVFNFNKKRHAVESVNNCEAIIKFILINCNHNGTKMVMDIKNILKSIITVPAIPEDMNISAYIFIWDNMYKE